jgi:hypothetical protein
LVSFAENYGEFHRVWQRSVLPSVFEHAPLA